jgi:uncharacterized protein (UPF0261 family)
MREKIVTEEVCKMANFIVMGTWDTKDEELGFLCEEIEKRSHHPIKLDLSTKRTKEKRDAVIDHTIAHAKERLNKIMQKETISGAISIGGGTNLFMSTKLMEELPLFIPKIIVSTMIVNSVHSFRTYKDIIYIQSPCDFGVLNPITKDLLRNCVAILVSVRKGLPHFDKPAIAVTGFGISDGYYEVTKSFWLRRGYHLVPFHSVGENTMVMAELIQKGLFKGILDLTLHDVMDHVAGGAFGKLDKNRLYAYLSKDIPAVIAPGGVDTIAHIVYGRQSLRSFGNRKIYHHDFRWGIKASKMEVIKAAKWIGSILEETNPKNSIFLIPLRGWSYPGERKKEFYDPEVIRQFTKCIRKCFREDAVIEVNLAINDPQFGRIACEHLYHLIKSQE